MEVLVDNLGQDVESAGGGIDAEHQGLSGAEQQHEAAEVQPRVAHHRWGTGDDVVVGDVLPRKHHVPEVGQRTENQSGVDRLETELTVNQDKGEDQQNDVDDHDEGTQAEDIAHQLVEHDGKTGDGTDNEFGGHQEIVNGGSGDHHTEGHNHEFFPELKRFHVVNSFLKFVVHFL